MAFGQRATEAATKTKTITTPTEIKESPWMPTGSGTRFFYVLPEMETPTKPRFTERKSSNGKPVKRDGKILYGLEPAEETVFAFAWWPVMVNGALAPRRIFFDPDRRYDNPLWKHIDATWPKVAKGMPIPKERMAIKLGFAMNVYDVTPVVRTDKGIFYPVESGEYILRAYMNTGKIEDNPDNLPPNYLAPEDAKPLNEIRVLEGSYGAKGLFQQFLNIEGTVEDADGLIMRLPEIKLRLRTTGRDLATQRIVQPMLSFGAPPLEVVTQTRYDLKAWTAPWPDEAVQALLDGDDFTEVTSSFSCVLFPEKQQQKEEENLFV